jgi:hypothetical protein
MIELFRIFLVIILAPPAFIWLPRMILFVFYYNDGAEYNYMKYICIKLAAAIFVICDIVYIILIYTIITNFMI